MRLILQSFFAGLTLASFAASANPAFQEKVYRPNSYQPEIYLSQSQEKICGDSDDLQRIEFYDNSYSSWGYGFDMVNRVGASTGAIKSSASSTAASYCSGTLVSPDLFLTASHCVGINTLNHFVYFGYQNEAPTGSIRTHYSEYYGVGVAEVVEDGVQVGLDYALLRLDWSAGYVAKDFPGSVELPLGWRPIRDLGSAIPNTIGIVQHPSGRPKEFDAGTAVTVLGQDYHYDDLDTERGSSGSGILNELGYLVGVHTSGTCDSGGTNWGPTITEILAVSNHLENFDSVSNIENFVFAPVGDPEIPVALSSTPQAGSVYTQNVADYIYLPVSWEKPDGAETELEFRLNGGAWQDYAEYDQFTSVARLCLSTVRQNGTPPGCNNSPHIYGGNMEFRLRFKVGGTPGPWRYTKVITVDYDS